MEVKYQHTPDAWWQLRRLYAPLVEHIFPHYSVHLVEVCKWFDPAVPFPERFDMLPAVEAVRADAIGVHIWKP